MPGASSDEDATDDGSAGGGEEGAQGGSYDSEAGTRAFLAEIDRTQKALANMQAVPPTSVAGGIDGKEPQTPGFDGFGEIDEEEDEGLLSGIGTLFGKGFDALGNFVSYTLANPISSVVNTAINTNPIGLGVNAALMATTGRSAAGTASDMLGSLGLGVPSDVSPIAAGAQGVAQDIASSVQGAASDLGGLFGGREDPGAMPDEEMPGYSQKPGFAQGGLASLPQISYSGLYRAMGRG